MTAEGNVDPDQEGAWERLANPRPDCHPGGWMVRPPGRRAFAPLSPGHTVTEHDDGTITVRPSIGYGAKKAADHWHGYLTRGVWKQIP